MATRRGYRDYNSFDPDCEKLAQHFLADAGKDHPHLRIELASAIQEAVEDFFIGLDECDALEEADK